MSEKITTGIIGLGRSGWNLHAATLEKQERFQVVAVADPESTRREEAVARFGCRAYQSPQELIADPNLEFVVIATPSHTHGPLAIEAMRAGKHVLVEKPMATSLTEADAMIAVAQQTGKVLCSYQVRRMHPDFLKIQEILNSGVLGPIHLIKLSLYGYQRRRDWQTLKKFGGGQLNNTGTHFVDQVLCLAGGEWHNLFADVRRIISAGDADDHVKLVFRGKDDIVVDVEISSAAAAPAPPHWTILGRYGALTGSLKQLSCKYYDPTAVPERKAIEDTPAGRAYEPPEDLPWVQQEIELEAGNPAHQFYDALYKAIREGQEAPAPGREMRNLIALFEASRNGSAIAS